PAHGGSGPEYKCHGAGPRQSPRVGRRRLLPFPARAGASSQWREPATRQWAGTAPGSGQALRGAAPDRFPSDPALPAGSAAPPRAYWSAGRLAPSFAQQGSQRLRPYSPAPEPRLAGVVPAEFHPAPGAGFETG